MEKEEENKTLFEKVDKMNAQLSKRNSNGSSISGGKSSTHKSFNQSFASIDSASSKREKPKLIMRDREKAKSKRRSDRKMIVNSPQGSTGLKSKDSLDIDIDDTQRDTRKLSKVSSTKEFHESPPKRETIATQREERYQKEILELQFKLEMMGQKFEEFEKRNQEIKAIQAQKNDDSDLYDTSSLVEECYLQILGIFKVEWTDYSEKPPQQELIKTINNFTSRIENLVDMLNSMQTQVTTITEENMQIKQEQAHILKKCQFMISNAEAENDDLVHKYESVYHKLQHARSIIGVLERMLRESNDKICIMGLELLNEKKYSKLDFDGEQNEGFKEYESESEKNANDEIMEQKEVQSPNQK